MFLRLFPRNEEYRSGSDVPRGMRVGTLHQNREEVQSDRMHDTEDIGRRDLPIPPEISCSRFYSLFLASCITVLHGFWGLLFPSCSRMFGAPQDGCGSEIPFLRLALTRHWVHLAGKGCYRHRVANPIR